MTFEEKTKIIESVNDGDFWIRYIFNNNGSVIRIDLSYELDTEPDFIIWLNNKKTNVKSYIDICHEIKEIQKKELEIFSKIFELFEEVN